MAEELSLETILPKEFGELTEDEVDYLNDNKSQLNAEQLKKFDSVLTDQDNPNDEKDAAAQENNKQNEQ